LFICYLRNIIIRAAVLLTISTNKPIMFVNIFLPQKTVIKGLADFSVIKMTKSKI